MKSFRYYIPGTILIVIAFMIIAVPEILVAFVAALIVMAGIGALYIGNMVRKSQTEFRNIDAWFFDKDTYDRRFVRGSVFRQWLKAFSSSPG